MNKTKSPQRPQDWNQRPPQFTLKEIKTPKLPKVNKNLKRTNWGLQKLIRTKIKEPQAHKNKSKSPKFTKQNREDLIESNSNKYSQVYLK